MYPADLPPADPADAIEVVEQRLVRVDEPDLPGALASSRYGSVLAEPPDLPGLRWRLEPVPEVDVFEADAALEAIEVGPWHEAGARGQGVHVAVFDIQWNEVEYFAEELGEEAATFDCFDHRSCETPIDGLRPRSSSELGQHGIACAELIHEIAPEAQLSLVRVSGLTSLENGVEWAIRNDVDLISMSLSFFNESFYQGRGPVNRLMDELAAAGILMVTSAGNYAEEHHWGWFEDDDLDGVHDFPDQASQALPVYWGTGSHRVNLIWDDFQNCGDTDLDLYVYDEDGNLVGRSREVQAPDREDGQECQPVERATVRADEEGWYYLVVHRAGGSPNTRFDIMARSGEVWMGRRDRSITDPGNHPSVLTVGAVRVDGYRVNGAESFSSVGPTHDDLPKPELAAPNGVTTAAYGARGFFGTSAATPIVAGALAVVMSEDPRRSAWDAAALVRDSALLYEPTDAPHDDALGAGRVVLPHPEAAPLGCSCSRVLPMGLLLPLPWVWGRRRSAREHLSG